MEADAVAHHIIQNIGPIATADGVVGVRPLTINASEASAFNTATGLLGFQVGDLSTGQIIYDVPVSGFGFNGAANTAPSHGISISPDETEIYLIDSANSYVHVYDISGLPFSPPSQVAAIPLVNPMIGNESPCAYDCVGDGWLHHSHDGRYVFVGDSGDVIDTRIRATVATIPVMATRAEKSRLTFNPACRYGP